jgi:DNA repair protein RadC
MTAHELSKALADSAKELVTIRQPSDIFPLFRRYLKAEQEHFFVVTLNGTHAIIKLHVVTIGLVNRTLIHPREVFRHALLDNAAAVILCHNHPSGALEPSEEDLEITKRMTDAGLVMGISVLDHLIISIRGFLSIREKGLMP